MTYSKNDEVPGTTPGVEISDVVERQLLIGRDRELAKIEGILKHRGPVLVVVSAPTGTGKSSLLREIQARANEHGWHTAYRNSEGHLCVTPSTTERIFGQWVLKLLGLSTDEALGPTTAGETWPNPLHSLLLSLGRQRGVLLIVDGYHPKPRFEYWFTSDFIGGIKQSKATVMVVVADQKDNLDKLRPFADEVISLGPLDRQAVRRHFESIAQQIAPPMKADELDAYVGVAREDPGKLAILSRVLKLAIPAARSMSTSDYGEGR